jgi:hypothetical protein
VKRLHIPWIGTIQTSLGWGETIRRIFRVTLFSRFFWRSLRAQRAMTREKFAEQYAAAIKRGNKPPS